MVATAKGVAVDLEEVEGFSADTQKFAILIKDAYMAENKMQDDVHDCQCVSGGIGVGHQFHSSKHTHAAACNEIVRRTLESIVFLSLITVNVKYHKRCHNGQVIDKLVRFSPGGIGQSATKTACAHLQEYMCGQ